jgi:hypothetical protein
MISNALRSDIERWAARRDDNPVFQLARAGRFNQAMVARYIANVTHMIRLTPGHLRQAQARARALSDTALVQHYEHKFAEEIGHAAWGEADLAMLAKNDEPTLTSAFAELADHLTSAIDEDPAVYLCWLALTEYITVLLGPELLSLIEERNGVPRTSMTVIDNHIELDREHAEEAWGVIDDLVGDPRKIGKMREALATMLAYVDAFSLELATDLGSSDESEPRLTHARVVSAA